MIGAFVLKVKLRHATEFAIQQFEQLGSRLLLAVL
jgi:hypothetical protein